MKKITLFLILLTFSFSHATIIVKDIADFTFTSGATLDFDFNSDGTAEFSFEEMGVVGTFYDSNDVNFVAYGSFDSGYGWDVMRALSAGTSIGSTSAFYGEGDAYINPFWANSSDYFPVGDSYIGTKFKIGSATYYGWILVNSTGGSSGVITVKSYAYNNVANSSITAGQTLGTNSIDKDFETALYPNPTVDFIYVKTEKVITSLMIYNATGKIVNAKFRNGIIDFSEFSSGLYFINIGFDTNEFYSFKQIKL